VTARSPLAAGAAASLLGLLFFGDRLSPSPAPPSERGSLPLARLLPRLPARNVGRFERPGDPLNLVFVGSREQVVGALEGSGWTRIPVGIPAALRAALGELARGRFPRTFPPMNVYRLEGRAQDLNWSRPITRIGQRHHFRLWRSGFADERGREVWWGSGNRDIAVRWRDLSHVPDPDADAERDYILRSLASSPALESAGLKSLSQIPREGFNDKGYPFATDGRALVLTLR